MTSPSFFKIAIGLVIFLAAAAYQVRQLERLAPSLEDFSQTTNISGIYSYEWYGRSAVTKVDEKLLHCGVNYEGSHGSCSLPLKEVPKNSYITAAAASIKTDSGSVLYAMSIMVDGQEVYRKSPRQALHDWWFDSCLAVTTLPLLLIAIYIFLLIIFIKVRG